MDKISAFMSIKYEGHNAIDTDEEAASISWSLPFRSRSRDAAAVANFEAIACRLHRDDGPDSDSRSRWAILLRQDNSSMIASTSDLAFWTGGRRLSRTVTYCTHQSRGPICSTRNGKTHEQTVCHWRSTRVPMTGCRPSGLVNRRQRTS